MIDCGPWTLLFWRGLLMSLGLSVFLVFRNTNFRNLKGHGWTAATCLAFSTVCFVLSLQKTDAANTLVIIATSPLLAALMSRYFLAERVDRSTWIAITTAMFGVSLSLIDGAQRGELSGEMFAVGSALGMAGHFTSLRAWQSDEAPLSVWGAGGIACLVALPLAEPFSVPPEDVGWLVLLGLIILPTAFGLMAIGPKHLPAPEVGLLLLGETVLGPIWVWLVLEERPGNATLLGGFLVIITLAIHSRIRQQQQSKKESL